MNMVKNFVVSALLLSAAVPSFAGQGAFNAGAFESLQQAAASGNLDGAYDNAALKGAASSQGAVSARTLAYRPQLDAPRVIAVTHKGEYKPDHAWSDKECNGDCGFNTVFHPANEMLASNHYIINILGVVVGAVLLVPSIIASLVDFLW